MKLISLLYKTARTANTIRAISRPARLPRRVKNIIVGRAIARSGIFK